MKKYLRQLFLFSSSSYAKVPEKENKNRENGEHFFYLSAGQGCKVLTKAMYHIWNFSPFLLWSFLSAQATLSPVVPPPSQRKALRTFLSLSLFYSLYCKGELPQPVQEPWTRPWLESQWVFCRCAAFLYPQENPRNGDRWEKREMW